MKNRKKLFKCSVLLLLFIFFINGCQTDDAIIIATNGSEKPTIQNLSFDNAKNIPDFLEVTNSFKVSQILNKEKEQKNSRNQNKSSENNFTINTQTFNRFEKENYISYTFEINKEKNINKNFFQNLVIERKNSLFINFLPNLASLGIQLPRTAEEWTEFGDIFIEVMYEIIPDLIPGIAEINSLKNSISAFDSANYTDGSTELAFAIVGVIPAGKLMKVLAKFVKLAKKTARIFKTYIKLSRT